MIRPMAHQTLERPAPTQRPRRGAAFWVGIGLILAGLAVLGYVAWQFFGTNVVSHRKQQRIVEQTERAWSSPGTAGATGRAGGLDLHGALALMKIPKFGKKYVMPVQAGVSDAVLAEGFGHFKGTAGPGQVGHLPGAAPPGAHGEALRPMPHPPPRGKGGGESPDPAHTYPLPP